MSGNIDFELITRQSQLISYCDRIAGRPLIAFDTEFVSEDRYLPELCLLQVAAGDEMAIIDTVACPDVMPFWDLVCDARNGHETVAHAAREEFRFCVLATGQRPHRLFDTQIAAGLIGLEYPAAYSNLVARYCDEALEKHETRTNWRKRPLSAGQLQYAIKDVLYLESIHRQITSRLQELERLPWLEEEMERRQQEFETDMKPERWRKLPGIASLSGAQLAVVRELWRWREDVAESRDMPARRVLRDDLLVELCKRGTTNLKKIRSIRGMDYSRVQKFLPEISAAIDRGLQIPRSQWPEKFKRSRIPNLGLLGQFLATALGVICREQSIAANLAASTQELRTMAAWRLGMIKLHEPPRLYEGWRRQVIADEIERVLEGKKSLRVADPRSTQPLTFDDRTA
jgi:ribonuclease D